MWIARAGNVGGPRGRWLRAAPWAVLALLLPACGGGAAGSDSFAGSEAPSSQSEGGEPGSDFSLVSAHIARLILDPKGEPDPSTPLVNPASVVSFHPLSGQLLPEFPAPLEQTQDLHQLAPIDFAQLSDPLTPAVPLVPRNGALVLTFNRALATPTIETAGAISIVDAFAVPQDHRALIDPTNPRRLILTGVTTSSPGWPASPLVFDTMGSVVQDVSSQLSVMLSHKLTDVNGQPLTFSENQPGSAHAPLRFQTGNPRLEAMGALMTANSEQRPQSFNGFLPDLEAPRIVRTVRLAGVVTALSDTSIGDNTQKVLPSTAANDHRGEWAGAQLAITSQSLGAAPVVTRYDVSGNENNGQLATFELSSATPLAPAVALGDTYELSRLEYFEPLPGPLPAEPQLLAAITVDPIGHPRDRFDPQDALNSDLRYFVEVVDPSGTPRTDLWDPASHRFLALPPRSSLRLTFSEPMEPSSFAAYESFAVSDGTLHKSDAGFGAMRVGRVVLSQHGRVATFEPVLEDQVDPAATRFIGFGGTAAPHRLVLRTRPPAHALAALMEATASHSGPALFDLDKTGVVGITDLAGRGLGLPAAMIDPQAAAQLKGARGTSPHGAFPPAVDFSAHFETLPTDDPDFGVVVHRFMGQAEAGAMSYLGAAAHDTVTSGVEYHDYPALDGDQDGEPDRRFLYGPSILDVGLNVPGRLMGAGASKIEHLIDPFNAPKQAPFSNPNGEDFLISVGFGLNTPLNSPFGARFQHIYRAGDASPSYNDFVGTVLDLEGLAWSPFGGNVTNTTLDDMEILVGMSGINRGRGPNTNQTNGIPDDPTSGLVDQFDCNVLQWAENCQLKPIVDPKLLAAFDQQPRRVSVVRRGTPYTLDSDNLFDPANAGSGPSLKYLDFPRFNGGFDPTFGHNNVNGIPYDSQFPMLIEYRLGPNASPPSSLNFFGFSPGILSSALPRFRVWSQGQHPLAHGVPNYSQAPTGSSGFGSNFRAGEGGPLVAPRSQTTRILAPQPNNGMPDIPASAGYISPPRAPDGSSNQPQPDWVSGAVEGSPLSPNQGCITSLPVPNSNPLTNSYFANGMLPTPLPNLTAYPGPTAPAPTQYYGYGLPDQASGPPGTNCLLPDSLSGSQLPGITQLHPMNLAWPSQYGDNSRYFMMWKYAKRISRVESPAVAASAPSGMVRWQRPIVSPAPAELASAGDLRLEIKTGSQIDFAAQPLQGGYIDSASPAFVDALNRTGEARPYVKFRATFGVTPGRLQPPSLETVVLPFEIVRP